jgi:DNA polymerase-3 subunit beta
MDIKVSQENLNKALGIVSRVAAGSRTTLPILNNVLIRAVDGKISFTTTNLEISVVSYVIGEVVNSGVITVPVKLLAEFVSNLPKGGDVNIKVTDGKILITAGKYRSNINAMVADEFPELPEIDETHAVVLRSSVDDFKKVVGDVVIASSNDNTRPVLTGVYCYTLDKNLYFVATDGYRLAEQLFIRGVESDMKVIIPTSSLQEVVRSLGVDSDEIEILIDETQVKFRFSETEVTSKLIDGSFPDYKQLIPKKSDIAVLVPKDEFTRAVKLAALFAREVGGSIACETKTDGVFQISALANELGENTSEIKVNDVKDGKVVLNSRFLLDVLNVLGAGDVSFEFSGKLSPVIIRNKEDKDCLHLIMPLKS